MDLIALLEHAPALLEACISCSSFDVGVLRLINKESSRVALKGLRSYALMLIKSASDTDIRAATLLQRTNLEDFEIMVTLSGGCMYGEVHGEAANS